jgi:hypothetical protein
MTAPLVHPLVLAGYGLVEAPFDRVVERFGSHRRADQTETHVVEVTPDAARALAHRDRRTAPATRLVIVEHGTWAGVLTSQRSGSDFDDHQHWAARTLGVRTVRVVDCEARWWRRGQRRERLGYEARIFELHGSDDSLARSIACADDGGRWVFETSGEPLPAEAAFASDAPRRRDRFPRANLHDLLRSIGAEPLVRDALVLAPRFALLDERIIDPAWRGRVEAAACSLEEADDPAFRLLPARHDLGPAHADPRVQRHRRLRACGRDQSRLPGSGPVLHHRGSAHRGPLTRRQRPSMPGSAASWRGLA